MPTPQPVFAMFGLRPIAQSEPAVLYASGLDAPDLKVGPPKRRLFLWYDYH
jgi:hypothetical protein